MNIVTKFIIAFFCVLALSLVNTLLGIGLGVEVSATNKVAAALYRAALSTTGGIMALLILWLNSA